MEYQVVKTEYKEEALKRKRKAQFRHHELVSQLEKTFKVVNSRTREGCWDECQKAIKVARDIISELQLLNSKYEHLANKARLGFLDTIESSDLLETHLNEC